MVDREPFELMHLEESLLLIDSMDLAITMLNYDDLQLSKVRAVEKAVYGISSCSEVIGHDALCYFTSTLSRWLNREIDLESMGSKDLLPTLMASSLVIRSWLEGSRVGMPPSDAYFDNMHRVLGSKTYSDQQDEG